VVVDRDFKTRRVALHQGRHLETTASWCQYHEQICRKLVVTMGTSLIVVVVVGSEGNESGKWAAVDGELYDAVTLEVMRCPVCVVIPLVPFSSDI
jgi:hypothetical protein